MSELASGDPISVIRRQARASLRAIQEAERMAGRPAPKIELPRPRPYEAWYPPRGLDWPGPVVERLPEPGPASGESLAAVLQRIDEGLRAEHFRDLNNANNQAPGAKRMMIDGLAALEATVRRLADRHPESAAGPLRKMVDSPYPTAHYLALREIAEHGEPDLDAVLIGKLEAYSKTADTVGFYWTCEALSKRGTRAAIPALIGYAGEENPRGLHGPIGMGYGYPAARAIAVLAREISDGEVQRLLASENIWLRAGALAGLVEARTLGVEGLLRELIEGPQPGLIHAEAVVGLSVLGGSEAVTRAGSSGKRPMAGRELFRPQ